MSAAPATDIPAPAVTETQAPAPAAAAATSSVAPPTPEKKQPALMLDLAFCCDCTGSMAAYLKSAQDNIRSIAQIITERKGQTCSIKYALVKYRDHPPQDSTFVTESYPFTPSLDVMKANVDTMVASGGGDGPEAVTAGLQDVLDLNWRDDATKVCVLISDAPPHGLGESGDGFPNGDPDGRDPIKICRALAEKGVTVYAIGVEPVLSTSYKYARDFMMMVASITEGKFLPLGKASILADVIVSTSIEGMELNGLWATIQQEVASDAAAKKETLSEAELCDRVEKAMASRAHELKVEQIDVSNPYMDARYNHTNRMHLEKASSLADARKHLKSDVNEHVAMESAGYNWGAQAAQVQACAPMAASQMSRATNMAKKKAGLW